MAKKKPDDGLTADELTEVQTLDAQVQADEVAAAHHDPGPAHRKAVPVPKDPSAEIARLEARIKALQAELARVQHPVIEFPKMVKGRTFQTREEQDAAGAEFAD